MPLRIHLAPTGLFSPAMTRISSALIAHKPPEVVIAPSRESADICLLFVINRDAIPFCADLRRKGRDYAILQCCLGTSGATREEWTKTWEASSLLWSYYDLRGRAPNVFYSPLGVSSPFIDYPFLNCTGQRQRTVLTSGHVSGPGAEEIDLVWRAARRMGVSIIHTGADRVIDAYSSPLDTAKVNFVGHIPDDQLAHLYSTSEWVAGLRYGEGFELPLAEGACCGARGIAFHQPAIMQWHVLPAIVPPYVLDEHSKQAIYAELCTIFDDPCMRASDDRILVIEQARRMYDWAPIAREFWARLLNQGAS